jgi:hypothetical protein
MSTSFGITSNDLIELRGKKLPKSLLYQYRVFSNSFYGESTYSMNCFERLLD